MTFTADLHLLIYMVKYENITKPLLTYKIQVNK